MNLLKKSIICLTVPAFTLPASAVEVNNTTAGNLRNEIADPASETYLKVSGTVNAADLEFINSDMPKLKNIDLSAARIASDDGAEADIIPAYAFFGSPAETIILPAATTGIGEAAFASSAIKEISVPASVVRIDRLAFDSCEALEKIEIPATVGQLGEMMFRNCPLLVSATIGSPVDKIGAEMFLNCRNLTSVSVPSVSVIGDNAFNGCLSLANFNFTSSLTEIGKYAFYDSGLESANMERSTALKSIGDFAFAKCGNLQEVILGSTTDLGKGVFFDDKSLSRFTLPASVTEIPAFTFKGATSINPTVIDNKITRIDDYALTGWNQVKEFSLPANLEYIGKNAMEGWTSATSIDATDNKSVPALGENVWENVSKPDVILYVNTDTENDFKNADQWKDFKIEIKSSDINTLIPDNVNDAGDSVTFSMADRILLIESKDRDIVDTVVFDLDGRRRYGRSDSSDRVVIDTKAWTKGVIIVSVRLSDNSTASIKLTLN